MLREEVKSYTLLVERLGEIISYNLSRRSTGKKLCEVRVDNKIGRISILGIGNGEVQIILFPRSEGGYQVSILFQDRQYVFEGDKLTLIDKV